VSHLDFVFSRDTVALAQVLEARRIVEIGNVRLAAERITDQQLLRLDEIVRQLRSAVDDADRFSTLDIEFHELISEAAANFLLAQFMKIIGTLGKQSRALTGAARSFRQRVLRDHHQIVEALVAHDPDAAANAMRSHLEHVQAALNQATSK
jgi:GntR family transcriptional repressor for pyruvate dehydrogenase complex